MNETQIFYDSYLAHHGIKGMKWGQRRYQNENGSLTPAGKKRLKQYKNDEIQRLNKKYNTSRKEKRIDKISSKIDSAKEHGNVNKSARLTNRKQKINSKVLYAKGMKELEKSKITKMTYDDMRDEKIMEAKYRGQQIAASVLTYTITAGNLVYIPSMNTDRVKTIYRTTEAERESLYNKTHKK